MRQKLRQIVNLAFFLAFPITLNWYSPYVIVDGAFQGIATASFIIFCLLFVSSLFLGRLWCSWLCPAGYIQDAVARSRTKAWAGKAKDAVKWISWSLWLSVIFIAFLHSGGIKRIDILHLMEGGVSVDQPIKYIVYYGVVLLFFGLSFLGKRAACHSICWMAPFMILSTRLSKALRLPAVRLRAEPSACVSCGACSKACPMSLPVQAMVKTAKTDKAECIHCGLCVESCAKKALRLSFGRAR